MFGTTKFTTKMCFVFFLFLPGQQIITLNISNRDHLKMIKFSTNLLFFFSILIHLTTGHTILEKKKNSRTEISQINYKGNIENI